MLVRMIVASSKFLAGQKNIVDALNVFPVPDGDTGTNMSLTMSSAAMAVQHLEEVHIGNVAKEVANGALMGARGNSGVILSQLFAGFANKAKDKEVLYPEDLYEALDNSVKTAYQAVMNPVEGTILTVSKEAARGAKTALGKENCSIETVLDEAHKGAIQALKMTPEMLPILKQAGVVDAGGQGFVYILEGMLRALRGEKILTEENEMFLGERITQPIESEHVYSGDLEFQYCTEFIVKKRLRDIVLDDIRDYLTDKGDCILVVGSTDTCKVHVHTNYPGKVIDFCTDIGSLHKIKIDNMAEQSQELEKQALPTKRIGIIAVSLGAGLVEIFKSLGVDVVISGGQTMNPSTKDFVDAVNKILADEVLILPNNKNVIMASKQAAQAVTKPIQVVETRSIPQGIAALMAYNAETSLLDNKHKMEEAGKQIVTIEATYAVRDAKYDGHDIKKGEILGIVNDKLTITGSNPEKVVEDLIDANLQSSHELVTLYFGEEKTEQEAQSLVEKLSQKYEDVDFELHFGGQPLYYYLVSIE